MKLFKQDGDHDVLGAGIEGATAGWQIGKLVALVFMAIGIALFYVLKFVLPLVIRFLAFVVPILWRLFVQGGRWAVKALAAGIATMKARFAGNPTT